MTNSHGFFWRCPGDPSAIALLSMPALSDCFDRTLPESGGSRFALLLDSDQNVVDEVVVTALSHGGCEVACHGGAGVRQRVGEGLRSHGLHELTTDSFSESAHWNDLAHCAHPAALRSGLSPQHPLWAKVPHILITGPSNAGKSTLLNAWVGHQRALASPVAGTTRDLVHADVQCDGWNLRLTDSAGLRETDDHIEAAGQDLIMQARKTADLVLFCDPAVGEGDRLEQPRKNDLIIGTKADLANSESGDHLPWAAEPYMDPQQSSQLLHQIIQRVLSELQLM